MSVQANATTAGTVQNIQANALTTGQALYVSSSSAGLTTGSLAYFTTATTGAVATNGIVSLNATGNYTSTTNVGLLNVAANATTAGTIQNITGNALTTGNALRVTSSSTGLTSGSLIFASTATTGAIATNGAVSFQASGNYTSTANTGLVSVQANSTTAGTVQNIQANALTTGQALYVSSSSTGLTSGSLAYFTSATTGAVATNGIVSLNATGNYTSTSNAGLLNVTANATTAGTLVNISSTSLSTGTALSINTASLTSGVAALVINSGTSGNSISASSNIIFQQLNTGAQTLGVQQRTTNASGTALTVSAGTAGVGASAFAGGVLTLNGGAAAGTGNANGGNVVLTSGNGTGTGVKGLVVADTFALSTASTQNCPTVSCTITQANIDSYGVVLITTTNTGTTATLGDPGLGASAAGRLLYITNIDTTDDFILSANGGTEQINLKPNTTATMIWNGSDWTAAGASSSTDLQAAYDNTAASAGGAELVLRSTLDSPAGTGGLTIRNNQTVPIVGGLLEVQTSIGSNLFSINNNATDYAANGGAESTTFTAWTGAFAGGSVGRNILSPTTTVATGEASVSVLTSGIGHGAENTLTSTLTANLTYSVSYAVRGTTSFSTLETIYSRDGTNTSTTTCNTAQTVTTGIWTRIICTFTAPSSGITAANSIFIRQTDGTGRTFYIDNLSISVNAATNHAVDGSVDLALGTNWQPIGGSVARSTSVLYDTSGSVAATTSGTAGRGVYNNLTLGIVPQTSTQYRVSFYARGDGTNTATIAVAYTPDNNSTSVSCGDYNTQVAAAAAYTLITCLLTTSATAPVTSQQLRITQTAGSATVFYVDALKMTLNSNNASNVQIGGANNGGPTTLFTLDRASSAPIADNNSAYLGSMYYDTTTGRIQCYEADGWGACGAAPDNIVNLNPEYAGAVLNGTGVGTMTADFCSNDTALSVNSTLCSTGQAKNYYKWTSPQATQQTYSIYVTYQLPATFNGFASDDTVQLVARTDSLTNAAVTYEMFKSTGSAVTQCGSGETTVVTTADTWQSVGISGNESTGCSFNSSSASNFVIFKINMKANSNANAYVSTLSFTTTGR